MKDVTCMKIGISGKRRISPEERGRVYKEIKERIAALMKKNKCNDFIGYSAVASGADTIFAEVVVKEFRMPLHIILPFAVAEYEKDFKGEHLELFRKLISENPNYESASEIPVNEDEDRRNAAYYAAGKKIVDECDEIIIVWDGLKPGGVGGTAEILGYSSEKIGPHQVSIIRVRPVKSDALNEELIHIYHNANRFAIVARNRYKRVWKWVILLGWITVICFAVKTAFRIEGGWGMLLTLIEFLFVAAVYRIIFIARKRKFHGTYLKERMEAETCRILRSFYHAGVEIGISDQSKEEGPILAKVAEKINLNLSESGRLSRWYAQYVIKSLISEQCTYYDKKIKSIGDNHTVFERINLFIGVLFFGNLLIHLVHIFIQKDAPDTWLYKFSVFFNIILPASYASLEGFIYFNEWAKLKKHSDTALCSLKEAEHLLPENLDQCTVEDCHKKQAQVLHLISSIMLTDNQNWNLLLENKDNYHFIV